VPSRHLAYARAQRKTLRDNCRLLVGRPRSTMNCASEQLNPPRSDELALRLRLVVCNRHMSEPPPGSRYPSLNVANKDKAWSKQHAPIKGWDETPSYGIRSKAAPGSCGPYANGYSSQIVSPSKYASRR
jgi:hypothetical protein